MASAQGSLCWVLCEQTAGFHNRASSPAPPTCKRSHRPSAHPLGDLAI